jgi:DNA-directed RNA polymerase specialized sigma24 family protein
VLRSVGIGDEAIVACRDTVGCWGWIKAYRDTDDPSFTEQDLELLGRVGPTLGSALRRRLGEGDVENLTAWFRTVVARVSLNILRARKAKREQPFDGRLPDPIVSPTDGSDPEHEALTSDSVGLALLVVLGTLPPAERLAFVLHDTFGVPFDEIALITGRSPAAARQLASRGRRRVRDQAPAPDPDLARQWELLDAFEAASREGDFEARSWPSRSPTDGSSRSTSSRIPHGSAKSICPLSSEASHHLRALLDAGFVTARREGRAVLYARTRLGDALATPDAP